jgi:hypothetical protein
MHQMLLFAQYLDQRIDMLFGQMKLSPQFFDFDQLVF